MTEENKQQNQEAENTYQFEKLSDFLQLSPEQFERMLPDLKTWFYTTKSVFSDIAILNDLIKRQGVEGEVKVQSPGMTWIDDGKNELLGYNIKVRKGH
ncbi:hypothetical protein A6046_03250 [[Haemophilus] ducreyi]|uniref:Uncharacterized protein n=2 Tax=Haemophilus ducreyi TaxID=730 RepID=Q7VPH4_HAEDU|nr:hypothetical protein [[Haemophilus] ducreyi]AAP95107.1 hypothetical protein HD_0104 [[Haemophilus] ducreyi 35000HP]AKO30283.1 hypothetical protein RY60_00400 [[Haemophilus] ducreyi]AKO31716.1 hypothetical protein RZ57_00405 [[Haemophilus] ducreyi]AKO33169.1 hypothetical protein RZ58_00405 [[Haemophilus] ducreyi]AKO34618.1 hypothetical protein RZ59_00400 [[Haemophilus] ducreyi]